MSDLTVDQFIAKWERTDLKERASYQQHFVYRQILDAVGEFGIRPRAPQKMKCVSRLLAHL